MQQIRRLSAQALLSVSMIGILLTPAVAAAQTAPAVEAERPIKPAAGKIRTFAGNITGTAGRIRTFEGSLSPDAGKIRTFAGNLSSLAGKIRTFQNTVLPSTGMDANFWGTVMPQAGTMAATAGRIRTFSGSLSTQAGKIRTFAGKIRTFQSDPTSAAAMMAEINAMISLSNSNFGAAYTAATGKGFRSGFVNPLLAKYRINTSDPLSLMNLDEATLELFLIDWNDNLMVYSGVDQVDHWMATIGWTPAMTQQLSAGSVDANIGVLDFTIGGDSTLAVVQASGISQIDGGHGTAVASLISSPHDGRAIMGIAPGANVTAFNPFDETMTAGWADIRTGLDVFASANVSVVNVSLGVPGWTLNDGWNEVFSDEDADSSATESLIERLLEASQRQLFVLAAGNDGVVQPSSIEWNEDNPAIIVVGSVDPNLVISTFSNRPGTTCLLTDGECESTDDLLMNHFIVAPGEFMLVDNGAGGVTRMSGTSLAAPLVSGTAALIVDRWPWLAMVTEDIGEIILDSATDLGATGTDAVYGRGLLNVAAALGPRNFNALSWRVRVNGQTTTYSAANTATTAIANKSTWEANSAYVTVYESTDHSFRDFVIPLSTKLYGQNVGSGQTQFMSYLSSRFWNWATVTAAGGTTSGFTAMADPGVSAPFANFGDLEARFAVRPRAAMAGFRESEGGYDAVMSLQTPDQSLRFDFGNGNGAPVMGASRGFALQSDYDLQTGGANPFLGMAAGSGFASVNARLDDDFSLAAAFSHRDARGQDERGEIGERGFTSNAASAYALSVTYEAADWLSASASYTMLEERDALLGVRSLDPTDFAGGSRTDAATFGVEAEAPEGITLAASATMGNTRQGDGTRQNLRAGASGIASSAWQVSAAKTALISDSDSLRLSIAQPLHLDGGTLEFTQLEVIDRQTGELGEVTQSFAISAPASQHVAEAIYRLPLLNGRAGLSLFGQYRMGALDAQAEQARVTAGAGFSLRF